MLTQIFHTFSSIDGRVLRSFRDLVFRPGRLTQAFQRGLRRPFIGPFQVFITANVLFFALQSFSCLKIFMASLAFRLEGQLGSAFSADLVNARLAATARTFAAYAPVFDQAVAVNAKSLIGLMVPPFAILESLVLWRSGSANRQPFGVHAVFSLHFYSFLLLLFCVPLAIMAIDKLLGGSGLLSQRADDVLSVILVAACAAYLYFAIRPVYGARGMARVGQAVLLTVAVVGIFLMYRFALLPITLYTT